MVLRLTSWRLVSLIAICAMFFVWLAPASGIGDVGVASTTFGAGCLRTALSFAIGVLLHRLRLRLPPVPVPLLLLMVLLALLCPWGGVNYDLLFVLVLSPLIVATGASVEPAAWLAATARRLGIVSFPLYAVHRPLLALAQGLGARLHLPLAPLGWAAMLAVVTLAALLPRCYDEPLRTALMREFRARLKRDPGAAAAP